MFGGNPVLLEGDLGDRQFANNVTGVVVQLGRNSEKWETRVGVGNVQFLSLGLAKGFTL